MRSVRQLLAVAIVLLAIALLPFATGGWMALPPPLWIGLAVAALAVWALHRGGPPRPFPDAAIAALFGLAAAAAHLRPGMLLGHDVGDHSWGAWAYLQAWRGGDLLPIWLHHLGLGQPMPIFYGPLPFWMMAPFALTGSGAPLLLGGSLALASVVAALSAWAVVARWTGTRRGPLVASLAIAFAPYRLFDANYRIALAETWAIALLPLALFAYERLLAGWSRRRFALAAGAVAAVTLAHPLSLVILAVSLGGLAVARFALATATRSLTATLRGVARCTFAAVAGLALAGFFVVPLISEIRYARLSFSLEAEGRNAYVAHGLHPIELVVRRLWDRLDFSRVDPKPITGGSTSEQPAAPPPEQPYYVGLVLLATSLAATVAGRSLARDRSPLPVMTFLVGVSLASSLAVIAELESHVPGLVVLQFPWRFLGLTSAAAALAAGLTVAASERSTRPRMAGWLAAGLALALLADGFPFSGAVGHLRPWQGLAAASKWDSGERVALEIPPPWPMRVIGLVFPPRRCCADVGISDLVYREYFTAAARATSRRLVPSSTGLKVQLGATHDWQVRYDHALPYARLSRPGRAAPKALVFERGGGRIDVTMPDDRGGSLVVAEQYFPGWQVETAAGWREADATPGGLLTVDVPQGSRLVRFRFHRWRWDRALGWVVTLVAFTLGLALLRPERARPLAPEAKG